MGEWLARIAGRSPGILDHDQHVRFFEAGRPGRNGRKGISMTTLQLSGALDGLALLQVSDLPPGTGRMCLV